MNNGCGHNNGQGKDHLIDRRDVIAGLLASAGVVSFADLAAARVKFSIKGGNFKPFPIAIPNLGGDTQLGQGIAQVVMANLLRSGVFSPLDQAILPVRTGDVSGMPNFGSWKAVRADAVAMGQVRNQGGKVSADLRLWDVIDGQQLVGQRYGTNANNWRRVAHQISDAIYEAITGVNGYFDSRVVFIDESGSKAKRVKRLAIMDQDGANVHYLTNGNDLVLTPRFSPTRQEITYMSYGTGNPRVYLLNIETGQRELVGNFPSMTFAPRFSPNGHYIILSLQQGSNANIYTMDLRSRKTTMLTNSSAIDTAPSYSPDGSQIVYESDRSGRQQIYRMSSNGQGQGRISRGAGAYSTPVWSPKGDLIAFTKQVDGRFEIGVMKPNGQDERILTSGYHNEGPTFSPNGQMLMFFRDPGGESGPRLYSVDIWGRKVTPIKTPSFASDPAWSPLIG